MCPGSNAVSYLHDEPGCCFQRCILHLLMMICHMVVAGTLEIRRGVQTDCDIGEMDINRMQFIKANASHSRIICCMNIQGGNQTFRKGCGCHCGDGCH